MSEAATSKKEPNVTEVTMDDGTVVTFPGKRRLLKSSTISEDGFTVETRFDFVNGEFRIFKIEADNKLFAKLAAHGAEQKIGDEIAGLDDIEDAILAVDNLMDRLKEGKWQAERESSGLAGTSILARALIKQSGKSAQVVKEFLKGKTNAEKLALRNNPAIAPIIAELEKNRKKKVKEAIDTDSLLEELA